MLVVPKKVQTYTSTFKITQLRGTQVFYYDYYHRYLFFVCSVRTVFSLWLEIILQRNNKIFLNKGFPSVATREETVPGKKHTDAENLSDNFFIHFLCTPMLVLN